MRKMRRSLRLKTTSMLLASLGLLVPQQLPAAPPAGAAASQPAQARTAETPAVIDVALAEGGRLNGQALDRAAGPAAGKPILVMQQGRLIASTRTDAAGRFSVDRLTGGVYEVQCDGGESVSRLWAPRTAPPAAKQILLVTCGDGVVRGQTTFGGFHGDFLKGPGPWVIAAATIIAVPTALALGLKPKSPAS
jgi:hypothetical protein